MGFVASQGVCASELRPRLLLRRKAGAEARLGVAGADARHPEVGGSPKAGAEARPEVAGTEARHPDAGGVATNTNCYLSFVNNGGNEDL